MPASMSHNVPQCPTKKDVFPDDRASANANVNAGDELRDAGTTTLSLAPQEVGHSHPQASAQASQALALHDRQLRAIELLVQGLPDNRVADEVGVDRRTIYRWRRDPDFTQELEDRRQEAFAASRDRLRALLPKAFEVLSRQVSDRYDRTAFRAASLLVRVAFRDERLRKKNDTGDVEGGEGGDQDA